MDGIENIHFLRPWLLLLALPLLLLVYKLKQQGGALVAWQKVCDPALFDYLKVGVDSNVSNKAFVWLSIIVLLLVTALAGPVWKQLPQPMYSQQSAVVVLLDLSKSMDAGDLKPSRLIRGKQKLTDLFKLRKEGQTALVVFAGSAFVVTPLSDDHETVLAQLQSLTTDIMPQQGGNIDAGLEKAMDLLKQAQVKHGVVIALTDSERFSADVVNDVVKAGHSVHVIGVGTTSGAPIPQAAGGFVTDRSGNIVVPQLAENRLRELASLGQGYYRALALDDSDLKIVLSNAGQDIWKDNEEKSAQTSDQWQEEGPWLLLLVLPLVLMGFRRGVLVVMLCAFVQTPDAHAGLWQDLWKTKQQQGEQLLSEQKYEQAAETFSDPSWQAAAAYKQGDYEAAKQALDKLEEPSSEDIYNQGNTLAQLGELDKAIAAYEQVLKQNSNHQDALANKALVEKLKQQQQEQENQDKNQEQGDKNSEQDSKQSQQGEQGEDNQEQQSQDSQHSQDSNSKENQNSEQQSGEQSGEQSDSGQEKQDDVKQEQASQAQKQEDEMAQKENEEAQQAQQGDKQDKQRAQQQMQDDLEKTEAQQAFEQTLRRVPDDPGGLLRRKFLYQYQNQQDNTIKFKGEEQW